MSFQEWKIEDKLRYVTLTPVDRKSSKEVEAQKANLQSKGTIYASQSCGMQERRTLEAERVRRCCGDRGLANPSPILKFQDATYWLAKDWP